MGTDQLTLSDAAVFAAWLPEGAQTWRVVNSPLAWDDATRFAHSAEFHTRLLVWQKTKDGQDGKKQPEPAPTPEDQAEQKRKSEHAELMAQRFREKQRKKRERQVGGE